MCVYIVSNFSSGQIAHRRLHPQSALYLGVQMYFDCGQFPGKSYTIDIKLFEKLCDRHLYATFIQQLNANIKSYQHLQSVVFNKISLTAIATMYPVQSNASYNL
jgi:hypothetical protein